jgi:putative ABC transport system ATP-binding protein
MARDSDRPCGGRGDGKNVNNVILEARSLRKAFGRTEALRGASLSVGQGEVVAITGPSGSGKSTLLLCLAGVLRPEAGQVHFSGQRLDELAEAERTRLRRRQFGLVLQFGQLVPELTAVQNVALPLLLERHDRAAAARAAQGWLERLGALEVAGALPGEMSGGEAQRVAIARALVTGPTVIFADEPTGALDTVNGEQVLQALLSTARETSATVVLVTHDNRVAANADREVELRDGAVEPATVTS